MNILIKEVVRSKGRLIERRTIETFNNKVINLCDANEVKRSFTKGSYYEGCSTVK